jgi:hypothetical protein
MSLETKDLQQKRPNERNDTQNENAVENPHLGKSRSISLLHPNLGQSNVNCPAPPIHNSAKL